MKWLATLLIVTQLCSQAVSIAKNQEQPAAPAAAVATQSPAPTPEPTPEPVPEEPYITGGYISDGLFDSSYDAAVYAESVWGDKIINEGITGYYILDVYYSDGSTKYTVEWY